MSSRFDRFITSADRDREMGDAIEALEGKMTALDEFLRRVVSAEDNGFHIGSPQVIAAAGMAHRDTKALRSTVEALETRVQSIAADLSRLEQRTASPPKPEPLADGEYLVRWHDAGSRAVGKVIAGQWLEELGRRGPLPVWTNRVGWPAWIGPRVDLPK